MANVLSGLQINSRFQMSSVKKIFFSNWLVDKVTYFVIKDVKRKYFALTNFNFFFRGEWNVKKKINKNFRSLASPPSLTKIMRPIVMPLNVSRDLKKNINILIQMSSSFSIGQMIQKGDYSNLYN